MESLPQAHPPYLEITMVKRIVAALILTTWWRVATAKPAESAKPLPNNDFTQETLGAEAKSFTAAVG